MLSIFLQNTKSHNIKCNHILYLGIS